jgi:hypothetical protein
MKRMHCSEFCSPSRDRDRVTSVTGCSASCEVVLFSCGLRLHWDDLMICLIFLLRDKKKVSLHLDSSFTYPENVAREFSMDFTDTLNQGMMVCCPTGIIQIPNNNKPREVFSMITSDAVRFYSCASVHPPLAFLWLLTRCLPIPCRQTRRAGPGHCAASWPSARTRYRSFRPQSVPKSHAVCCGAEYAMPWAFSLAQKQHFSLQQKKGSRFVCAELVAHPHALLCRLTAAGFLQVPQVP